jgi:YesN/AraC family two-component response regulator
MDIKKETTREDDGKFPISEDISSQIKKAIRAGNTTALKQIFAELCERWPIESLDDTVFIMLRKKLLTGCGRAAQIAIDEGVPYQLANSLSESYFTNFETAKNLLQIRDLSFALLLEVTRLIGFHKYPKYSQPVRKMLAFIKKNIGNKLTLNDIATDAGLSPNYATALFKKETGLYLKDEIRKIRVEVAMDLLAMSSSSIADIAAQTGFRQTNHFSRVFKMQTGLTPKEYRNIHFTGCKRDQDKGLAL